MFRSQDIGKYANNVDIQNMIKIISIRDYDCTSSVAVNCSVMFHILFPV